MNLEDHIFTREYSQGTFSVECSCGWSNSTRSQSFNNKNNNTFLDLEIPHKVSVLWEEREAFIVYNNIEALIEP